MSLRVLLVDDQALVRTGFRLVLEAEPDILVVGEAPNGQIALDHAARLKPDVVIMDVRMPEMDGLEATRRLLAKPAADAPKVIMLTTFDLDEYVLAALHAGASGFLLKDTSAASLADAVRTVASGDALLAPAATRRLIRRFTARPIPTPLPADLTDREFDVLRAVAQGLTNGEIATQLYIAESTVKTHVRRLLSKLNARDRVALVIRAYHAGLD